MPVYDITGQVIVPSSKKEKTTRSYDPTDAFEDFADFLSNCSHILIPLAVILALLVLFNAVVLDGYFTHKAPKVATISSATTENKDFIRVNYTAPRSHDAPLESSGPSVRLFSPQQDGQRLISDVGISSEDDNSIPKPLSCDTETKLCQYSTLVPVKSLDADPASGHLSWAPQAGQRLSVSVEIYMHGHSSYTKHYDVTYTESSSK